MNTITNDECGTEYKVTAKELLEACVSKNIQTIPWRKCGLCGHTLKYLVVQRILYYDSSCGCTTIHSSPQVTSWEEAAYNCNMQQQDLRKSFAARFGVENGEPCFPVS